MTRSPNIKDQVFRSPKPESEIVASRYGLTDDGAACGRCGQWMETDEDVDGCEDRDCPHHK